MNYRNASRLPAGWSREMAGFPNRNSKRIPMSRLSHKDQMPSNRKRKSKSPKSENFTLRDAPKDLASLVRGLYRRVASQLNLDPSYVSRVARSERESEIVAEALRRELRRIVQTISNRHDGAKKRKKTRTQPT